MGFQVVKIHQNFPFLCWLLHCTVECSLTVTFQLPTDSHLLFWGHHVQNKTWHFASKAKLFAQQNAVFFRTSKVILFLPICPGPQRMSTAPVGKTGESVFAFVFDLWEQEVIPKRGRSLHIPADSQQPPTTSCTFLQQHAEVFPEISIAESSQKMLTTPTFPDPNVLHFLKLSLEILQRWNHWRHFTQPCALRATRVKSFWNWFFVCFWNRGTPWPNWVKAHLQLIS